MKPVDAHVCGEAVQRSSLQGRLCHGYRDEAPCDLFLSQPAVDSITQLFFALGNYFFP